jgi:hypothetical protein
VLEPLIVLQFLHVALWLALMAPQLKLRVSCQVLAGWFLARMLNLMHSRGL